MDAGEVSVWFRCCNQISIHDVRLEVFAERLEALNIIEVQLDEVTASSGESESFH